MASKNENNEGRKDQGTPVDTEPKEGTVEGTEPGKKGETAKKEKQPMSTRKKVGIFGSVLAVLATGVVLVVKLLGGGDEDTGGANDGE